MHANTISKAHTALHWRGRQARVVCTERPVRLQTRAAVDPAALDRAELAAAAAATANADASSAARYRSQRGAAHEAGESANEAGESICASVYLASAAALPEVPAPGLSVEDHESVRCWCCPVVEVRQVRIAMKLSTGLSLRVHLLSMGPLVPLQPECTTHTAKPPRFAHEGRGGGHDGRGRRFCGRPAVRPVHRHAAAAHAGPGGGRGCGKVHRAGRARGAAAQGRHSGGAALRGGCWVLGLSQGQMHGDRQARAGSCTGLAVSRGSAELA